MVPAGQASPAQPGNATERASAHPKKKTVGNLSFIPLSFLRWVGERVTQYWPASPSAVEYVPAAWR